MNMDTATLQIWVFGAIVAGLGAFGSYMAARQHKSDADAGTSQPPTLL